MKIGFGYKNVQVRNFFNRYACLIFFEFILNFFLMIVQRDFGIVDGCWKDRWMLFLNSIKAPVDFLEAQFFQDLICLRKMTASEKSF